MGNSSSEMDPHEYQGDGRLHDHQIPIVYSPKYNVRRDAVTFARVG